MLLGYFSSYEILYVDQVDMTTSLLARDLLPFSQPFSHLHSTAIIFRSLTTNVLTTGLLVRRGRGVVSVSEMDPLRALSSSSALTLRIHYAIHKDNESTRTSASGASGASAGSGRRGPLSDWGRADMKAVKRVGACWRCIILRKKVGSYPDIGLFSRNADWRPV
jgi:hypothetical protein